MSLVPLIFSDWWENLDDTHHLLDQNFGLGLHPNQLIAPRRSMMEIYNPRRCPAIYRRPWADLLRNEDAGVSKIHNDKDKFQVQLDVQQFKPEEISCKVVDKFIVVNASHEERKDDHGFISRQFTRKYLVPDQCNIDQVKTTLSSDGVLSIEVPRKEEPKLKNEKTIKIEHTGKPALKESSEKDTKKPEEKKK